MDYTEVHSTEPPQTIVVMAILGPLRAGPVPLTGALWPVTDARGHWPAQLGRARHLRTRQADISYGDAAV